MKYTIDSRSVKPGMCFVALKGEKVDGRDFIDQALANGASKIIEGLEALQEEARNYRKTLKAKVIGVTGSAGKTTTKEFLKAFLGCYGTEGNFNNHIGLPLTILNCPQSEDYLVLEMGTNHPGEIALLCDIADPDIGVLTSIGSAHIENFKTHQAIEEEKTVLLRRAKDFSVRFDEVPSAPFGCPLPGDHNETNMALALEVAKRLGISEKSCEESLAAFSLPGSRWRKVEKWGATFIDDSYNANPESMKAALDAFMQEKCFSRRFVILGDMLELGENSLQMHKEVFNYAMSLGVFQVIGIGEMSSKCLCHRVYKDVRSLKKRFRVDISSGDLILLKASHSMNLGELIS
jgi:UDP-N-acetylmuramoyl-tripeptide--D-alanyl-D-alanine ligase